MTRPKRFTEKQLAELFGLIKESDAVELKLTVPDDAHRRTIDSLELDPLQGQIRQVFFFDTPNLDLFHAGVVVRGRRTQGRGDDSVVKLRPVVPHELPEELRAEEDFGVEVDAMPGGYVCSASYKAKERGNAVRSVLAKEAPLKKLFAKPQRDFFRQHAPEGVKLSDLSVLGPLFVLKLKFRPSEFDRKMVAELWLYPDGARILELSTKCAPHQALDIAMETRLFLDKKGVDLGAEQTTKTKTALTYYSKEIKKAVPAKQAR
jgi:hypothetical protein